MDKYDAAHDHYCYPGTSVLKNKLGIKDIEELEQVEGEITYIKQELIQYTRPPYDLAYLQDIHQVLFIDIYDWAGEIRNVDIAKGRTRFCNCDRIIPEADRLFEKLEKENWLKGLEGMAFCQKLAEYTCELNLLHPFRDGNGRVLRLFLQQLALSAGYLIDWEHVQKNKWIKANIRGVHMDYEAMASIYMTVAVARFDL